MALYFTQVSIDVPVVIEAEDEDHVWEIARDDIREILGDVNLGRLVKTHVVREVSKAEELPKDWDDRCIPYGGDGNTRIAEILGRIEGTDHE